MAFHPIVAIAGWILNTLSTYTPRGKKSDVVSPLEVSPAIDPSSHSPLRCPGLKLVLRVRHPSCKMINFRKNDKL